MVSPNTLMARQDLIDFVAAANAAAAAQKIQHGPFTLFNPTGLGGYFDMAPPYALNDRGEYDATATYMAGDRVTRGGYQFVCVYDTITNIPPLDDEGNPTGGATWQQPWYSCYQRIRDEVGAAATLQQGAGVLGSWRTSVSGPWPCQTPSIFYDKQAFYYADTGNAESVTISGPVGGQAYGTYTEGQTELMARINKDGEGAYPTTYAESSDDSGVTDVFTAVTGPPGQFRFVYGQSTTIKFVVGGTEGLPINATFTMTITAIRGWAYKLEGDNIPNDPATLTIVDDDTDPTSLITVDTSDWFGGGFTASFAGWTAFSEGHGYGGAITLTCVVNSTIAPGEYSVTVTSTADPNNRASGELTIVDSGGIDTASGYNEWAFDTFLHIPNLIECSGDLSGFTVGGAVEAAGIHDSKKVMKIALPPFNSDNIPTGLFGGFPVYRNADGADGPFAGAPGLGLSGPNFDEITETTPYYHNGPSGPIAPLYEPTFVRQEYTPFFGSAAISASTAGYWFGETPPINSLGMLPFDDMPWNKFPVTIPTTPNAAPIDAKPNLYLGYTLPYTGGTTFTGAGAQRAYNDVPDKPLWVTVTSNSFELLPDPKQWKPLVFYPTDFVIIDSYGNMQTVHVGGWSGAAQPTWGQDEGALTFEPARVIAGVGSQPGVSWRLSKLLRQKPSINRSTAYKLGDTGVDANGNQQTVTVAGTTPATFAGPWQTSLNALTTDGPVTWELTRLNPKFTPPVARTTPPVYPFFWDNPVSNWEPNMKYNTGDNVWDAAGNSHILISDPGTSGAFTPSWSLFLGGDTGDNGMLWRCIRMEQPPLIDTNADPNYPHGIYGVQYPFSFLPQGWWIYRVALNRIPQKKSKVKPPSDPIAITLGCRRNGSFVAFGTYNTGQVIDGMWPVFTTTALAYRCSERVDLQPEILTCGLHYTTWGAVAYPLAAAHLNDVAAVMAML